MKIKLMFALLAAAIMTMGKGNCPIVCADVLHLKNGNTIEGAAEYTSKGVWMQGVLFTEDEIEKVEKADTSTSSADQKSWFQDAFSIFGDKKEMDAAPENARKAVDSSSSNETAKAAINLVNKMFSQATGTGQVEGGVEQGIKSYQDHMNNMSTLMQQAVMMSQQVQHQAAQKQMMMEEEIRQAESGDYDNGSQGMDRSNSTKLDKQMETITDAYQKNIKSSSEYQKSEDSYSSRGSGSGRTHRAVHKSNIGASKLQIGPQ